MTDRTKLLIGTGVVIVIAGALVVWYFLSHKPLPVTPLPDMASSTPTTATTTTAATGPLHITENATYYDVDAAYPSATILKTSVSAAADAAAIATMKTFEQDTIAQFKKDGNFANLTHDDVQMLGLDQRKYAISIEYKTYSGPRTVSYAYLIYQDTGGAHPNTYYHTFTFDTKTGAQLAISDLFSDPNYLQTLSTIAHAQLPKIIAGMEQVSVSEIDTDQLNPGITPTADNFQNFYIEGKNLVIVFPPYQVGPYALGTVLLPIPLSQLSGSLKVAYQ